MRFTQAHLSSLSRSLMMSLGVKYPICLAIWGQMAWLFHLLASCENEPYPGRNQDRDPEGRFFFDLAFEEVAHERKTKQNRINSTSTFANRSTGSTVQKTDDFIMSWLEF